MTEDEAKTKWCPFARVITGAMLPDGTADAPAVQPSFNRVAVEGPRMMTPYSTNCIGSACMAFRWMPDTKRGPGPLEEKKLPPGSARELGRRAGFVWVPGKREDEGVTWGLFPRIGFCGLAGKP